MSQQQQMDVEFCEDNTVIELVHQFFIIRRPDGLEIAVTTDSHGTVIAAIDEMGMDQATLTSEEKQKLRILARR
jgi:hypothetical protein